MRNVTLRLQVIITVGVLILGVVSATVYIAGAISGAQESIIRLSRERLFSLTADLARRYGSIINFIAAEQFSDSSLASRTELLGQFLDITSQELTKTPDAEAGFYHALWRHELIYPKTERRSPLISDVNAASHQRFVDALVQATVEQQQEQWGYYESEGANFVIVTRPVHARNRFVGVAWAFDDLENNLSQAWSQDVTPFLQVVIILGILLASSFIITLRRDVSAIQGGLAQMKQDISSRLPVSRSELGSIAGSINEFANTISQQQREKEELQRTIQQKEKLASLGQLIAGVAHEVRTPLSAIKTRVQLWQRSKRGSGKRGRHPMEGPTSQSMHMVVEQLNRMETIVQKLLYFSKARSPQLQRVNLHELLEVCVQAIQPDAKKQRVKIQQLYKSDNPLVSMDSHEIREVFQNLFINSLEAMRRGGVLRIQTSGQEGQPNIIVTVEDSGPGISEEIAAKIFDPFFTTKETGIGLGLSIAYEIIRSHQGSLQHDRSTLGGARFVISLPKDSKNKER